jgi:hypothetical protein
MDKKYLILSDEAAFNEALFNGDIQQIQTFNPSTNGKHSFIENSIENVSFNSDFYMSMPQNNYMLLSDAYLTFELDTTTTTLANSASVETFITPNFPAMLINTMSINCDNFSYTITNDNIGRSLAILANVQRMRSFTPNQMALASELQSMTFAATDPSTSTIDLNKGLCIAKAGQVAVTTYTTRYYITLHIDALLPNIEKIKLMTGNINLSFNFLFDKSFITDGKPTNTINTALLPQLATVTNLTLNKLLLQHSTIKSFNDKFITNNSIEKLTGISINKFSLLPTSATLLANDSGLYISKSLCKVNAIGPILAKGKPLSIIIAPRIKSCKIKNTALSNNGPEFTTLVCDKTINNDLIACDNVTRYNKNLILNPLFYVNNLKVVGPSGTIYPNPRQVITEKSTFSSYYNYINSFVTCLGSNISGQDSYSCLTFNQYKNFFNALVIDVSNETTSSLNNSATFQVDFDINSIGGLSIAGDYDYEFDGDVFIACAILE